MQQHSEKDAGHLERATTMIRAVLQALPERPEPHERRIRLLLEGAVIGLEAGAKPMTPTAPQRGAS